MNTRTNVLLTSTGAVVLLAVLVLVVYTVSQPMIPNTGVSTSSAALVEDNPSANLNATNTNDMLNSGDDSIDTIDDNGNLQHDGSLDPTGNSHSE